MRPISKRLALLLCTAILSTSMFGCKKSETSETTASQTEQSKKDVKITFFIRNLMSDTSPIKSFSEQESLIEWQKKTGLQIQFIEVSREVADEQFKLMIASGDYPDVIEWKFGTPSVAQLYQEGVVIKLNDLIDKYAPNYKKALNSDPEIKREIMLDDGAITSFQMINALKSDADKRRAAGTGFVMRKDWLDNVNEKVPTTLVEWEKVLKAFKDKDPNGDGKTTEIPFDGTGLYMFALAHDVRSTFYLNPKTGKVAFGPIEPEYKTHIALMNKWYTEGLVGPQTLINDGKVVDANINGNVSGSFKGLDNAWTKYLPGLKAKDPKAEFVGVPWPKGNSGKAYTDRGELLTHLGNEPIVITSKCKSPEDVVKAIDYVYTAEGTDLMTWGIEGKSYTVNNGKKQFIPELITNNTLSKYTSHRSQFPKFGGSEAITYTDTPEMTTAKTIWGQGDTGLLLPPAISFTTEENKKISEFNTQLGTYSNDMYNKFVKGEEPLSKFDDYVQAMKKMGIEDIIKVYQTAYDRYKARK